MNRKSQKSITFFGNLIDFVKFNLIIRKLQNLIGLMLKLKAYFDKKIIIVTWNLVIYQNKKCFLQLYILYMLHFIYYT